jgi:protein ImuB
VLASPWSADVLGDGGRAVGVDDRGTLTCAPSRFRPGPGDRWQPVAAWAGPWPVDELWWETSSSAGASAGASAGPRRVARFQVVGVDGSAWLMTWDSGVWWTEAAYD